MIEVKSQRRARGTVFDRGANPDGSRNYTAVNYTGDVFYDNWDARGDGETGWRKVDITLSPLDDGWQQTGWMVQFAPYVATIPLHSDGRLEFCDKRNDAGTRKNMPWELEAMAIAPVQGVASGREVIYTDAYGPGAHLVYRAQRHGVAKLVRIDPTSAVAGPFVFRAHLPTGWKVVRQGGGTEYELLPAKKVLDSGKRTAFKGDASETYAAPFRWYAGSPEQRGILSVTAENIGGNVWEITKQIPEEWDRTAPIEMDVTATSTLSSDGTLEDAGSGTYASHIGGSGTLLTTSAATLFSYHKGTATTRYLDRPYMVFTNAVPGSATVSAVRVKLFQKSFSALAGRSNNVQALAPFTPGNYASVVVGDYSYTVGMPSVNLGQINVDNATDESYLTWTITNASHIASYVHKGSYDGWAIRDYSITSGSEQTDLYQLINGGAAYTGAAAQVEYEATENAASNPPVEEIDYTVSTGYYLLPMLGVG